MYKRKESTAGRLSVENPRYLFYKLKQLLDSNDVADRQKDIAKQHYTNAILSLGDGEWIYRLALEIDGVDIEKLQQGVINGNSAIDMFYFAKNIKGANVLRLAGAVASMQDANVSYLFMRNIKGFENNISLENVILNNGDVITLFKYAKFIKKEANDEIVNSFIIALNNELAENNRIINDAHKSYKMAYLDALERREDLAKYAIKFVQEVPKASDLVNVNPILNKFDINVPDIINKYQLNPESVIYTAKEQGKGE